ncbi:hypothetical protein [Paracoccus tibetensis]|uniref:N-acetyltransferase domain-containing protein n=1 Tax=Paracoccus tibetensis TaxID=336292 RepID=A0A1G5BDL6_9RHOB|nr:hypothetical protein [Paracoccus tibetensis]SCX88229.1 hypothetical protein SAMN05660710_00101 [Paracoccus tibetensis]
MIREAREADIPRIIGMVEQLAAAVNGPQKVCRIRTGETLSGLITRPDGGVWISERGFIAGVITQTIISPDPVAVELGWWAADRSGLRLLRAFEAWARGHGATLIKLSCNGGPAQQILERSGYRVAEIQMVR